MAQPKTTGAIDRRFDDAKLAGMIEPLTVRVEKLRGSGTTPIPMPEPEDGSPAGTNYTKDNVRSLETWLVTEWSGGGIYNVTVTDSSTPPQTMNWKPVFDVRQFPEKTPPPLASAASETAPPPAVFQPQMPGAPRMTSFPNGLPPGTPMPMGFQQGGYAQQQPYFYPPMPPAPQVGSQQWSMWQAEAERRANETELRQLRAENERRDRQALEAQHKAERDAAEARHKAELAAANQAAEQRFQRLEQLIAQNATQQRAPNAELEAVREEARRAREQAEEQRRQTEVERRDHALRELITQTRSDAQRQFDQLAQMMNTAIANLTSQLANAGNASQPLISMMLEQARTQADAIKEVARNGAAQVDKLQAFMMNPRDMIAMAKESAQQVDAATDKVANSFGRIIELQQKVAENALQLAPQGSGAIDLVRDGVQTVKDIAERYTSMKSLDERLKAEKQAQTAELQARVYLETQRIDAMKNAGAQPVAPPPPPPTQAQLAGVAVQQQPTQPPPPAAKPKPEAQPQPSNVVPITSAQGKGPKRLGRTDEQWFGVTLPNVIELRNGVSKFLAACFERDEEGTPRLNARGEIDGVSPEQTATFLMQAVGQIMSMGVVIPAMAELLMADRFADFMDVLLPDAPAIYRDDAVQALIREVRRAQGLPVEEPTPQVIEAQAVEVAADEGDDEDGDDDDDDADDEDEDSEEDDDEEPEPTPPPQPVKAKRGREARP